MPIRDVAAQNSSLDNDYGVSAGPNAPSEHELAIFAGDPLLDGAELTDADCPGYSRLTVEQGDWPAAADGAKTLSVNLYAPTGEWSTVGTHWALIAAGEVVWDCGEFVDPVVVTGAGDGPLVVVTVFYDNDLGLD